MKEESLLPSDSRSSVLHRGGNYSDANMVVNVDYVVGESLALCTTYYYYPLLPHRLPLMIQSYEEEVLVWVFPNHKCQKSLSKSRGEAE